MQICSSYSPPFYWIGPDDFPPLGTISYYNIPLLLPLHFNNRAFNNNAHNNIKWYIILLLINNIPDSN